MIRRLKSWWQSPEIQRLAALWLALLFCFFMLRLFAWHDQHVRIFHDARSHMVGVSLTVRLLQYPLVMLHALASDTLGAGIVALLLLPLTRKRAWRIIVCLFLGYALAGNIDQIRDNHTNLNLLYSDELAEGAFVFSSLIEHSLLLRTLAFSAFLFVYVEIAATFIPRRTLALGFLALAGTISLTNVIKVPLSPYMDWVYINPFVENLDTLKHSITDQSVVRKYSGDRHPPAEFAALFATDLSGERFVTHAAKPNILVVSVEEFSSLHVQRGWTPKLAAFADKHIYIPHLVEMNAITVNGVYAMMCGDYPYLQPAQLSALWTRSHGTEAQCLPKRLKAQGYHTIFLQATSLTNGGTDKLIAPMGFDIALGQHQFEDKTVYNAWGLDDKSFARNILAQVHEQPAGKPWFIMATTIGTHIPFDIPPHYADNFDKPDHAAFAYMDEHIGAMLETLEKEGALENTLVVITTDESRESVGGGKYGDFSGNQGIAIIAEPGGTTRRIDTPFMQADLALSLLDYIDAATAGTLGRSYFRTYNTPRQMAFGNNFQNRVFWRHADGSITACSAKNWSCMFLTPATPGNIFDVDYTATADSVENSTFIHRFLEYNDVARINATALRNIHAPLPF